jgi:hypothetical protein
MRIELAAKVGESDVVLGHKAEVDIGGRLDQWWRAMGAVSLMSQWVVALAGKQVYSRALLSSTPAAIPTGPAAAV